MKTKPQKVDAERRNVFVAKLADLWPVAKGSLTLTRSPCTRKNCPACLAGRKHPKWLFTFREEGKLRGLYVRPAHAERVRQAIENGRSLERLMTASGRDMVLSMRQEEGP